MDDIISSATLKFAKIVGVVRADLATIRTGKASSALLENLPVDAYGSKMKLVELATLAAVDANTLMVTPFDLTNVEAIVKAVSSANLGLTAMPEDTKIRCVVPPLSEERRGEYVKLAKTKVEGGKVMVRQIRHDAMEDASRQATDDDSKERLEKEIQALTDKTVAELELLGEEKEKELLTI